MVCVNIVNLLQLSQYVLQGRRGGSAGAGGDEIKIPYQDRLHIILRDPVPVAKLSKNFLIWNNFDIHI